MLIYTQLNNLESFTLILRVILHLVYMVNKSNVQEESNEVSFLFPLLLFDFVHSRLIFFMSAVY